MLAGSRCFPLVSRPILIDRCHCEHGSDHEEFALSREIGVWGYRYLRTRFEGGPVIFELETEVDPLPPDSQKLARHGFRWRTLRTVSIGLKPVVLKVKVPRARPRSHAGVTRRPGRSSSNAPPLPTRTRRSRTRLGA